MMALHRALVVSVLLYGSESWSSTLADRHRLDVFDMRCQRRPLRVFVQQHISIRSIRERPMQPSTSYFLRQRRLRCFRHPHRMPFSVPVRRVYDFNPMMHGWKRPRGRPKRDGLIPSSTTSILLASTPPVLHRWSLTGPCGRPLLADCQRSNPSKALK